MELKEIRRHSAKYWSIDGLLELSLGMRWTALSGLWLIERTLPKGTATTCIMLLWLALAYSPLLDVWILRWLRARITYPRVGYAKMKSLPDWVWMAMSLVLLPVVAPVALGFGRDLESILPPLALALLTLGLFISAVRARNERLLILAVISLGLGIWAWRTEAGWVGAFWGVPWLGLAGLILGAQRLRRFLRENPKVAEAEA